MGSHYRCNCGACTQLASRLKEKEELLPFQHVKDRLLS